MRGSGGGQPRQSQGASHGWCGSGGHPQETGVLPYLHQTCHPQCGLSRSPLTPLPLDPNLKAIKWPQKARARPVLLPCAVAKSIVCGPTQGVISYYQRQMVLFDLRLCVVGCVYVCVCVSETELRAKRILDELSIGTRKERSSISWQAVNAL